MSEAKTHIRHLTEGFDFLGFNIRHYPASLSSRSGYKLLIKPSQGSIQRIRRKLKALWRQHVGSPTVALINAMNPLIRGWSQYFRTGVASRVFSDLDTFMMGKKGQVEIPDAVSTIISYLHQSFGLNYDTVGGAPRYVRGNFQAKPTYNLTKFQTKGNFAVGNCYDLAASLAVLANLIGADAQYRYLGHWEDQELSAISTQPA